MPEAPPVTESPETNTDPAVTPLAEVYKAALEKEQNRGKPPPKPAPETPVVPVEVVKDTSKDKVAEPEVKEPTAKPTSALEAALEAPKPAEEVKPEDDPLADLDEKKPDWQKARDKIKRQVEEIQRWKAEVETARKPDPKIQEELATLRKQNAEKEQQLNEYKDAIVAVNIELEPSFRREFIDGRNQLVDKAAQRLKAYGGDADALKEALLLPEGKRRDEAIQTAMGEISEVAQGKIISTIAEIEKLDERRAEQLKDPQQSWERLQQSQLAVLQKQSQEIEARKKETWENVTKRVSEAHPTLKLLNPEVPGAEEWNKSVQAAREVALALHGNGATPDQTFEMGFKGARYDDVEKMLIESRADNAQLRKQLAEFEGSQPTVKGTRKPAEQKETDPGKIYEREVRRMKGEEV